jgi:hypothetical protein
MEPKSETPRPSEEEVRAINEHLEPSYRFQKKYYGSEWEDPINDKAWSDYLERMHETALRQVPFEEAQLSLRNFIEAIKNGESFEIEEIKDTIDFLDHYYIHSQLKRSEMYESFLEAMAESGNLARFSEILEKAQFAHYPHSHNELRSATGAVGHRPDKVRVYDSPNGLTVKGYPIETGFGKIIFDTVDFDFAAKVAPVLEKNGRSDLTEKVLTKLIETSTQIYEIDYKISELQSEINKGGHRVPVFGPAPENSYTKWVFDAHHLPNRTNHGYGYKQERYTGEELNDMLGRIENLKTMRREIIQKVSEQLKQELGTKTE